MNNKPLNDQQLLAHAKRVGRESEYFKYREQILDLLDAAAEESQEDYAAFLYAFSSIANEVQRRQVKPKRH